jgi:hypothetical protein
MAQPQAIRLAFCDLTGDWNPDDNYFTRALTHRGVPFTLCHSAQESPDFVLCGTFGHAFLQYPCCRILFSGEDNVPDFNLYDYAMGFPLLEFGGRYLRLPLYALRDTWAPALQKHTLPDTFYLQNRKFCNFVVSNDFSAERNAFFAALNAHRRVDSGGLYRNNTGGPVTDKLAFQKQYKFSIAYENSRDPGYTTEKIVDAFAAGTVPIYWGDPGIRQEFNPAAFVCADDYPDTAALISAIDTLDADDGAYLAKCKAPILLPASRAARYADDSLCADFLRSIFAKGPQDALCRNRSCWGVNYEHDLGYYYRLAEQAAHPKTFFQRLLGR